MSYCCACRAVIPRPDTPDPDPISAVGDEAVLTVQAGSIVPCRTLRTGLGRRFPDGRDRYQKHSEKGRSWRAPWEWPDWRAARC